MNHVIGALISILFLLSVPAKAGTTSHRGEEAGNSCKLSVPPAAARVVYSHGINMMTYPAEIDSRFTGCQRTWLEDGELFASFEYRRGKLYRGIAFEPGKKKIVCSFANENRRGELRRQCERLRHWAKTNSGLR